VTTSGASVSAVEAVSHVLGSNDSDTATVHVTARILLASDDATGRTGAVTPPFGVDYGSWLTALTCVSLVRYWLPSTHGIGLKVFLSTW